MDRKSINKFQNNINFLIFFRIKESIISKREYFRKEKYIINKKDPLYLEEEKKKNKEDTSIHFG